MTRTFYHGAAVFDGDVLHEDGTILLEDGYIAALGGRPPADARIVRLAGGIIAPGFVDLQVNGGGGVMFNDAPNVETLRRIATAHRATGTQRLLPTLITDTPEKTLAASYAVAKAIAQGVSEIAGLHLEGPHLCRQRCGAHDPTLIRPMGDDDEALLITAASRLPVLKLTVAPEAVAPERIERLARAGAIVSLGHSDCSFEDAMAAAAAGARSVTHLFNAMSQLGSRTPGLVGAALASDNLSAGIIADGIHVHPASLRAAFDAKKGAGRLFLVSDSMATAGSRIASFTLNGRRISRAESRLTLDDGTLAGADLEMREAVRFMCRSVGIPLARALSMATSIPARMIKGDGGSGRLREGDPSAAIHLSDDLSQVDFLRDSD